MKGLIEFLFFEKVYSIACRKIENNKSFGGGFYHVLEGTERQWYADPFVVTDNGKVFIFFEIMRCVRGKGSLGVTELDPVRGTYTDVKEVLREPFHLSYPNVFRFKNSFYMIPETNQANEIRIYEAVDFPYKWVFKKVLVKGINAVDSSILTLDERMLTIYSFLLQDSTVKVYRVDMDTLEAVEVKDQYYNLSAERPGGNVLDIDGHQYRIVQDCTRCYGEKLRIYEIDQMDSNGFAEHFFQEILSSDIASDSKHHFSRIHTLTRDGNDKYEAVDLFRNKFCWYKPFILALKRMLKVFK